MTEKAQQIRDLQQSISNRSIKQSTTLSSLSHNGEEQITIAEELRNTLEILSELAATIHPKFLEKSGVTDILTKTALEKGKERLDSNYFSEEEPPEVWGPKTLTHSHKAVGQLIKEFYMVRSPNELN